MRFNRLMMTTGLVFAAGMASATTFDVPGTHTTIAAAVAAANIAGGDTIRLMSAGPYTEAVAVDRSVSIVAGPSVSPEVRVPAGTAPAFTTNANVVLTLTGIAVNGTNNIPAAGVNSVTVGNGGTLNVSGCAFSNASTLHIGFAGGASAISLNIDDSTFNTSGSRGIYLTGVTGGTSNVSITNSTIASAGGDAFRINTSVPLGTVLISGNTIRDVTAAGDEGIQLGGAGGTVTISNNTFYNIPDDGLQIDGTSLAISITGNTFWDVYTPVRFDPAGTITGSAPITRNLFVEWRNTGSDAADKGVAIANPSSLSGVTENYNVFADANAIPAKVRQNVAAGANSVSTSTASDVVCSLIVANADFLKIKTTGPAFNIDGASSNAGAPRGTCSSAVDGWHGY